MANAPTGLATFPGVGRVLGGAFTLSEGISPSVGVLDVVPQIAFPTLVGPLIFTYGGAPFNLPGCFIDVSFTRGSQRGWVNSLNILDRRWRWAYGVVTGHYNVRNPDGSIIPETERSPRQLASILLSAMGETAFDVSRLPDLTRPEARWLPFRNPAFELQKLASSLGCRICTGPSRLTTLRPKGQGYIFPTTGQLREGWGINPPRRPDSLLLIGGPALFQVRFKLEAVGLDLDGSIRPIDELSYTPAAGWQHQQPEFMTGVSDPQGRSLALLSVFRWYRVVPDFRDINRFAPVRVRHLWQILPLLDTKVTSRVGPDDIERLDPAEVRGEYWKGGYSFQNTLPTDLYDDSFEIVNHMGMVRFPRPIYKLGQGARGYEPAALTLEAGFRILEESSRSPIRYSRQRGTPGASNGTGSHPIYRDQFIRRLAAIYDSRGRFDEVIDSRDRLDPEADQHLAVEMRNIQTFTTADREWPGLFPVHLDGLITQVTWRFDGEGAKTRVGYSTEHDLAAPSLRERDRSFLIDEVRRLGVV